jgi:DNA-binding MarR family transcriptional regulator
MPVKSVAKSVPKSSVRASTKPLGKTASAEPAEATWTFLSNHTHVLVCLAANAGQTLRDVSLQVGITERAVQRIVADLEAAGVLTRERDGRRNRYALDLDVHLRHALERHCRIGDILRLVIGKQTLGT